MYDQAPPGVATLNSAFTGHWSAVLFSGDKSKGRVQGACFIENFSRKGGGGGGGGELPLQMCTNINTTQTNFIVAFLERFHHRVPTLIFIYNLGLSINE